MRVSVRRVLLHGDDDVQGPWLSLPSDHPHDKLDCMQQGGPVRTADGGECGDLSSRQSAAAISPSSKQRCSEESTQVWLFSIVGLCQE